MGGGANNVESFFCLLIIETYNLPVLPVVKFKFVRIYFDGENSAPD